MNIISLNNFLLMLITQSIHALAQMQHTNDENSIVTCKGNDVDILWNVDEEGSKISQLQLYFNNRSICYISLAKGFIVIPSYQGRIERIGKTDFRLKNVSLDDEGNYTMLALIEWSTNDKMKKMVLRILEPPTEKCTCYIQPDFKCELPTSDCGRPTVSLVWKRKQTYEDLGVGDWIMNSTLQDEEILSCLDGEAMKCVNESRQFCTSVSIPHQVTERSHEDRSTQQTDSVTVPGFSGTNNDSTFFNKFRDLLIGSFAVATIIITVTMSICYRGKKCRKKSERQAYRKDASPDIEEGVPMNDTETEITFQTLQHNTLNPSLDNGIMKDSNVINEFQQLQNATFQLMHLLNQKYDTKEAVSMEDSNAENDLQKLRNATNEMIDLFNKIHEEYMIYARNATGKSVPKNQCMSHSDTESECQKLQRMDFLPSIDTEEAKSMNDLNIQREFQNLQKVVFHIISFVRQVPEEFITCTWRESTESTTMNQPMNNLDTEGDLQQLQQPNHHPILDIGEAISRKDSNVENEFQRLKKATHQMMHLFNQIHEEYMTCKYLPSHII